MVIKKALESGSEWKGIKVFFIFSSLYNSHKEFLAKIGEKHSDSFSLGSLYFIGDRDARIIRDLDDDDKNKIDLQKGILVCPSINASVGWWQEASRVVSHDLFHLKMEDVASKPVKEEDFSFDGLSKFETIKLQNRISLVNKYISEYNKAENGNKESYLTYINIIFPKQYKHSELSVLNYHEVAKLYAYGKKQKSAEWQKFVEFVKELDNFNELIAPKNEQQKSRQEILEDKEIEQLILDIKRRQELSEKKRKIREIKSRERKEKIALIKEKVAIWEIKALIKLAYAAESFSDGTKKVISKTKTGMQKVRTAVFNWKKEKSSKERPKEGKSM